ncbi:pyruvate-ferredoxin/flavodoxin oxidoreductase [Lachnotalea glycerini]|uniref:Pyruvate:ferredoxin oxidoreductase n=1 Tax=Lachnotalea glycerini TaxID=1763509 RepID=A0A255ISX9_9FIRM|nr:pyruvate:ferredoxin (flavodoxin) oxidoreductase [Lachnotalea glycerini]PXV85576.1 pyruvate-ferredoxin/flavodoxin oxidoreductase [Lachnotalea glycerini]RDY31320.1 pyruvate:ferredoxin (flavodoxin) oxidoreductase [Lachnotalea glycerini]
MNRKMKTMDGNTAAAHVAYAYSEVAAIYPITPSSNMAELADRWANDGLKNIFGEKVLVQEMQSEAGAAGAIHGSLAAGALTTTFTASQGLLLMIPNMYKIAGELLPCVINVSARALATHALSIFGDHSDVYACRQTGFAMLACSSVQETMDLSPISYCSALKGKVPFVNFFDGFRTSHELQKIQVWDYKDLAEMVDQDSIDEFRANALNPNHPCHRGSAQNPDIFFQAKEASNEYYNKLPAVVEEYMGKVNAKLGTDYSLFNYYGAKNAEHVIVAMGSVCETIEETIDALIAAGEKVGVIKVRLYRPFSIEHFLKAIPDSVKQISVLDRTKEPGSIGEPLYLDVFAALKNTKFKDIPVFKGRYGLGSKDTTPAQVKAVFDNSSKESFTIGIHDDVTNLSLEVDNSFDSSSDKIKSCKFWGLGSDGTVGANKNSIKIIGDNTDQYAQAYFDYDSKKSGGVTVSHLRFGTEPIRSTYLVNKANFVACHNPSYVHKFNMVEDLKDGGTFLLNCGWTLEELEKELPAHTKRYLATHNINFYTIDGIKLGKEIGLGGRINTILQSAFFKLSQIIPVEDAIGYMKAAAKYSYGKKGDAIVNMNYQAIERGAEEAVKIEIPASWANAKDSASEDISVEGRKEVVDFVKNIQSQVNKVNGNALPVSAFKEYADGTTPSGTSAYEKRGIAIDVPEWIPENCIQCNFCSYVCPHAVIRPVAMTDEEAANAPTGAKTLPLTGLDKFKFAVTVSALDCTGCGSCANVCPGKKGAKALVMKPLDTQIHEQEMANYALKVGEKQEVIDKYKATTVKGSQFKQPLLEFSGACAGCGETPYAKLVTQLFGDRMYIANATGCSSIWGNSSPSTPYTVNKAGCGPAWSNSLFEDNAEFGYGMKLAQLALRNSLKNKIEALAADTKDATLKDSAKKYADTFESGAENAVATAELINALGKEGSKAAKEILAKKDFISKKSQWIFGGDGWAYDIGFGGLDHVIASGQDVNILVFDTEVYSNTGGQSSKSTPLGAVAQFAAGGKAVKKKDLAQIAMSYGYVYVAQIAQGADMNQCIKAMNEAESYNGPSIIIAYAPCINHGIKGGMTGAQTEEKKAVTSGYWNLFRFDPRLKAEGKNPFTLDSKAPTTSYQEFLTNEVRYSSLMKQNAERAQELFGQSEKLAAEKFEHLNKLTKLYDTAE